MLFKPSRGVAPVAFTRQIAMYLTHVVLGRPLTAIGEFYGRDRTTVSHACGLVEDLRDLPDFEERMCRLEDCIAALRNDADWVPILQDWSHAAS
jgi:chromosomal replication initiation ATPase DnaA